MTVVDAGGGRLRRQVVRSGALVLVATAANRLVTVTLVIVLARRLSVGDFGAYSFATAYGGFVVMFVDLGLDAIVTRELSTRPASESGRVITSAVVLKSIVAVVVATVAAVATLLYEADLRAAALVATVNVVASVPLAFSLLFTARLRVVRPMVIQLVTSLATLAGALVTLRAGGGVVALVAVSVAGTALAALLLTLSGVRAVAGPWRPDGATVRLLARRTAPLAAAAVAVVVFRRVDQLLIAALSTEEELAGYAASVRIVDALNLVPFAVGTVAMPALAALSHDQDGRRSDELAATGYRLMACVVLPAAAVATVAGGSVLELVFGAPYRTAGAIVAVLLWAHYFGFAGVLINQVLIARDLARPLAALTAVGAVVNVVINAWAIPRFGGEGAAWASLVAYATPFLLGCALPSVSAAFRLSFLAVIRPAAAAAVSVVVLAWVRPHGSALPAVAVVVVAAALLATRATTVGEVRRLAGDVLRTRGLREMKT